MLVILSLSLAAAAAVLIYIGIRHTSTRRRAVLAGAAVSLCCAFYFGPALGGFWPGVFTLIPMFILCCVALPWLEFLWRRRSAG